MSVVFVGQLTLGRLCTQHLVPPRVAGGAGMYVYVCVCVCVCVCVYCVCVCVCVFVCVCIICMYVYTHTHTHIHPHIIGPRCHPCSLGPAAGGLRGDGTRWYSRPCVSFALGAYPRTAYPAGGGLCVCVCVCVNVCVFVCV